MNIKDLKDSWNMDVGYNMSVGVPYPRIDAARIVVLTLWGRLICKIFGHKLYEDACPESGHTTIYCERCGYSESFYM